MRGKLTRFWVYRRKLKIPYTTLRLEQSALRNSIFLTQEKSLTTLYSNMIDAPTTKRSESNIFDIISTADVGQVLYNDEVLKRNFLWCLLIQSFIIHVGKQDITYEGTEWLSLYILGRRYLVGVFLVYHKWRYTYYEYILYGGKKECWWSLITPRYFNRLMWGIDWLKTRLRVNILLTIFWSPNTTNWHLGIEKVRLLIIDSRYWHINQQHGKLVDIFY